MIAYALRFYDKLLAATWEHLQIVGFTLLIFLALAALLTVLCSYSKTLSRVLLNLFSMVYSVPSLALLALLIPITGLGRKTAVVALVIYNQYLLLRNFLTGLDGKELAKYILKYTHNNANISMEKGMLRMPSIRPISDLRNNANEISDFCRQTREPVFITRNGTGDMVVMNLEEYERQMATIELYGKLAIAEQQIADGAEGEDFPAVAKEMWGRVHGV